MSDTIRFVCDGDVVELRGVDPTMTVLNYLRTVANKTGTKEGCAEGDCGACTVVLRELHGNKVRDLAVNSCILFLPTLDGKELITVEDLASNDGTLHPVQRALVESHGSQCGFCTPGFVMSMFALYGAENKPSRLTINDTLSGNLCRCTGYAPIVRAAEKMYEYDGIANNGDQDDKTVSLLKSIQRNDALSMEFNGRHYFAPTTIAELAKLRKEYPKAPILAGGTDIGLWVTKQHRDLETVLYGGNVRELKQIGRTAAHMEIGAGVTLSDAFSTIAESYPDFGEVLRRFGSVPIRNAATLGGNIANASPIRDTMPPLIALDSKLSIRHGRKAREIPLDEFFIDYQKTALEPGEFIEKILIPLRPDHRLGVYKISKRLDQDISAVCAAFSLKLEGDRVADIRICFGGMAAIPKRAFKCEEALLGNEWSRENVQQAAVKLDEDFSPITDFRASERYRSLVAKNLLLKFLTETSVSHTKTRVIDYAGNVHA